MTPEGLTRLKDHEGRRLKPYDDATGEELISGSRLEGNITIGWGANISAGISHEEAVMLLETRVNRATAEARMAFTWFDALDPVRQDFIVMMIFNVGLAKFKAANPKMLAAIEQKDWSLAGAELMDGDWHNDVGPTRAADMRRAIEFGKWN